MPQTDVFTFKDAIDHGVMFLGADPSGAAQRSARMAALMAYRNLCNCHRWSYLQQIGRLNTNAPQSSGTITYDHTGGASERIVTLSTGTWPDWADQGYLVIGSVTYEVYAIKSSTVLQLSVNSNPGADLAAGTVYRLQRDTYPLPNNCLAVDKMLNASIFRFVSYMHPREFLEAQQINHQVGSPSVFTITGHPKYQGVMAVRFFPASDVASYYNFFYQRMPRELNVDEYSTGTVTTTNGSATVTGSGTSWTSAEHAGTVLRLSSDALSIPTGKSGAHPYHRQRVVLSVESATSLTVDAVLDETLTAVKYSLSDPVDLEEFSMLSAFQRGIEKELAQSRRMAERMQIQQAYMMELKMAMQADSRSMEPRAAGSGTQIYRRLRDYPAGADIG